MANKDKEQKDNTVLSRYSIGELASTERFKPRKYMLAALDPDKKYTVDEVEKELKQLGERKVKM